MKKEQLEAWKKIKGYNYYQISNLGRIRSNGFFNRKRENKLPLYKFLKQQTDKFGYKTICLYNKTTKNKKRFFVHRLVAINFFNTLKLNYNNLQVNHINHNIKDNRANNLEFVTAKENMNKRIAKVKFTENLIKEILKLNKRNFSNKKIKEFILKK